MSTRTIIEPVRRVCGGMESDHVSHDWNAAWVDPGGTIWGPGPYLKLPFKWPTGEDGAERIFCPYENAESIKLERRDGIWTWIVVEKA
jgi:hypothetical protein